MGVVKRVLRVIGFGAWGFSTLFFAAAWYHAENINSQLIENASLWKRLRNVEAVYCKGVMEVNRTCGNVTQTLVTRLGLKPGLEPLLTTAIIARNNVVGGVGGCTEDCDQ